MTPSDEVFPAQLVFVGGVPRSGTTVTHALLCTAPGAGPYTPEISFFAFLVRAYWAGIENWSFHTKGLFPNQETFRRHIADAARGVLRGIWGQLGEPKILCLKDPMLTELFPTLAALLPEAKFVTVYRDPRAVVRSRQEVHEKAGRGSFSDADVREIAKNYFAVYWRLLNDQTNDRQFGFRYEDLEKPVVRRLLAEFLGVSGFDEEKLWLTATGEKRKPSGEDPTESPKYSREIDVTPRLDPLPPEWAEIIRAECHMIMSRLRYS